VLRLEKLGGVCQDGSMEVCQDGRITRIAKMVGKVGSKRSLASYAQIAYSAGYLEFMKQRGFEGERLNSKKLSKGVEKELYYTARAEWNKRYPIEFIQGGENMLEMVESVMLESDGKLLSEVEIKLFTKCFRRGFTTAQTLNTIKSFRAGTLQVTVVRNGKLQRLTYTGQQ